MKQRILSNILTAVLPALKILVLIVLVLAPNQAMTASAQEPGSPPSDPACPNCQSPPKGGDDAALGPEDLAAALGTTGYDQIVLTDQDNGEVINLAAGQLLVVSLRANDSTGYGWDVAELDARVLQQVGEEYIQDRAEPGMTGVPGWQILRFSALRAGQTPLRLAYRRPWEEVPPLETFSIQVEAEGPGPRLEPERPAVPPTPPPAEDPSPTAPSQLPSRWHWCEHGACTPVRDQTPGPFDSCGSCWAFATVGPFESAILIRYGVVKDLSEQYLVSCNDETLSGGGTWGCNGGGTAHHYHYSYCIPEEAGPGARYEADFPYSASDEPCNPPHAPHEKLCGWHSVSWSVAAIKEAIYDAGPVKASVCAGDAFKGYSGGVFATDESAHCLPEHINHAIVLVGWDDAHGIWYLKNSWGSDWGEDGYMRIQYGTSNVGFDASYVVYEGEPPSTSHTLHGTAGENGWFLADVGVTLTAEDNPYGSGVELIQYELDGGGWQTYSGAIWVSEGRHTLSHRSQDKCGNWEIPQSIPLKIDSVPPSGSISLNRGSPRTYAAVVRARLPAEDATSGVSQVRVRDPSGSWTGWQAYDPNIFWQLPDPATDQTYTVEVQFKDVAGHTSGTYSDAIGLDIYPARPASASYLLARSTWGSSGTPASSANYQLHNTLGQPSMIGLLSSAGYDLSSGFWAQVMLAGPQCRVYLPLVVRSAP
jgi:predicted secreted protein